MTAEERLQQIRATFHAYQRSEGCDCCRDVEAHDTAKRRMADLLDPSVDVDMTWQPIDTAPKGSWAADTIAALEARLHHIRCVLVSFRSAPPTISTLQPVLDLAEEMAKEMCAEMEGKR